MRDIWLPLVGPNEKGINPKAVSIKAWQRIDCIGIDLATVDFYNGHDDRQMWVGMRLDNWIVVDCDCDEARDAWLAHVDKGIHHTWVRKTPHGWHFLYRRTVEAYSVAPGKYPSVHLKIDVKAGMGHQVVFDAPGYQDWTGSSRVDAIPFNPAWLPVKDQEEWGGAEWSEMPEGIGDNSMIAFAGTFRRWGMDQHTILQCLIDINAQTMTERPMPLKTLKRLARQAAKYNPEDPKTVLCPKCETEVEFR